jgi:hypothetical protein
MSPEGVSDRTEYATGEYVPFLGSGVGAPYDFTSWRCKQCGQVFELEGGAFPSCQGCHGTPMGDRQRPQALVIGLRAPRGGECQTRPVAGDWTRQDGMRSGTSDQGGTSLSCEEPNAGKPEPQTSGSGLIVSCD